MLHIASSIHHKIHGFVTREKAILNCSDIIYETFGLEILSPSDFIYPANLESPEENDCLSVIVENITVSIRNFDEKEREKVERFLINLGQEALLLMDILHPGTTSKRERKIAYADNEIIGVASWDKINRFKKDTNLYLFVDEKSTVSKKVIDHLLYYVARNTEFQQFGKIDLFFGKNQRHTRHSAIQRRYCQLTDSEGNDIANKLSKVLVRGVLDENSWYDFSCDFKMFTGFSLPAKIPSFDEFTNTGIPIKNNEPSKNQFIKLFDFETLISPGIVLCPKREAVIIPIQRQYAEELLGNISGQKNLFPSAEALLHVEKAYFKKPKNKKLFQKGSPLFFYISGSNKGYKKVVGVGRITYSDYLTTNEIEINLSRQGVLSRERLMQLADFNGKIHVITFDNFNMLPSFVPFNFLKTNNIVTGANLVTAQKMTFKKTMLLCEAAFK